MLAKAIDFKGQFCYAPCRKLKTAAWIAAPLFPQSRAVGDVLA